MSYQIRTVLENEIRFQERSSSYESLLNTHEGLQYRLPKHDQKDTEIFASQDNLMKSIMCDKWTRKEKDSRLAETVPQSTLRWIGGIWYLDGKQWYPSHAVESTR